MATTLSIRSFRIQDTDAVIDLWHRCSLVRPSNDPKKDIARKLKVRPDLFLVGVEGDAVVASAMVGYDGHRGWINYLGVAPECQKKGYGELMMQEAERLLRIEGCAKINLQVVSGNERAIAFYRKIGLVQDPVLSFSKRLEDDTKSQ